MKLYKLEELEAIKHREVHEWAVEKHRETGCKYSGYDYKLHLDAVVNVGFEYLHLLSDKHFEVMCGCSCHDVMEDCRVNWNDIKRYTDSAFIADIVYNVTNELGRNRKERADKTYPKIASCKYSTYLKVCDRIANAKFSYFMNDELGMFSKYKSEHESFRKALYNSSHGFGPMWDELEAIWAH